MNTDYKVEAIAVLLNEDCVLQGYFPLVPYKHEMVKKLKEAGCRTKSDCMRLSDEALRDIVPEGDEAVGLFRSFLTLYDIKPAKLREIDSICGTPEEAAAFRELYYLPGVKSTRAALYCKAGFCSLDKIARSSAGEIIAGTERVIKSEGLKLKVPLPKEIRTHIAVARAFTGFLDTGEQ